MQTHKESQAFRKNCFKILFFLSFLISIQCLNQMQDNPFVIYQKNREKTPNNLQENTESMKDNANPQVIKEDTQSHRQEHKITIDQQKANIITEKKHYMIVSDSFQEIHRLNQQNFQVFIDQNRHVVVNFYTTECQYCSEFNRSLVDVQKKLTESNQKVMLASLQLTELTQEIFKTYNIEGVPEIRYFYQGKPTKYQHNFIEYSGESMLNLNEWIRRISKVCEFQHSLQTSHNLNTIFGKAKFSNQSLYITEVQSLEEITKSKELSFANKRIIMLNCSYLLKETENKDLGEFLKQSYLDYLDHDFYCTQNHTIFSQSSSSTVIALSTTQLIFYVFDLKTSQSQQLVNVLPSLLSRIHLNSNILYKPQSVSQKTFNKNQQYSNLSFVYHENMKRYLYQNVEYWTNHSVLHVFTHNQPCFLMIINNETISKRLFLQYEEIKQKLTKNPKFPPIKFYFSDLSLTPQSTTRIKKYISGLDTSIKKEYPYPLLTYLKPSQNRIKKFVYEQKVTPQGMQKWISEVINKIELSSTRQQVNHQSSQIQRDFPQVKEYFRSTPQSLFPALFTQKFRQIYHNSQYSIEQKIQELKIPEKYIKHHNDLKLINFYDMQILLSDLHSKEFFVYVNWKNQIKAYELLNDIIDWWYDLSEKEHKKQEKFIKKTDKKKVENKISQEAKMQHAKQEQLNIKQKLINQHKNSQQQNKIQPQNKQTQLAEQLNPQRNLIQKDTQNQKPTQNSVQDQPDDSVHHDKEEQKLSESVKSTNIYVLNFNNNDYPPFYFDSEGKLHQLEINYVPSMLYFSADRKMKGQIQGLSNLQQVQKFIQNQFKMRQAKDDGQNNLIPKKQAENPPLKVQNTESGERELSGLNHNENFKNQ